MKARCKPGDLVMVVRGVNAGKTATVIREITFEERLTYYRKMTGKYEILNYPSTTPFWLLDRDDFICSVRVPRTGCREVVGMKSFMHDGALMPITPPESLKTEEHEKELTT